jgi:hypothetical protein
MPEKPPVTGVAIPCTRLPHESAKAYAAFRAYCELGSERTLTALAPVMNKSRTWLGTWSIKWQWQERIRAYEQEQEEIQRQASAEAALESAKIDHARQQQLKEKVWMIQEKMTEKFLQMIAFPVAKMEVKNSVTGVVQIFHPGPWRMSDAIRMGHAIQQLGAFGSGLTKKLTDPETGKSAGEDDEMIKPETPVELPRLEIVVVHQSATPEGGMEKDATVKPMKESGGFHFART